MSRETPFPDVFSRLGLITRIGSQPAAPEALLREPGIGAVVVEPADYRPGVDQRIYPAENTLTARLERDGVLPRGSISDNGRRYRSETGQIELRTDAGTIKVVAPRSEQFVLPSGAALSGDRVAVRNGSVFARFPSSPWTGNRSPAAAACWSRTSRILCSPACASPTRPDASWKHAGNCRTCSDAVLPT